MEQIKPYKKGAAYSYTLGAFPTVELLKKRPETVRAVYVHSTFSDREPIETLCLQNKIPLLAGDKLIARLSDKENVFVLGVFDKYETTLHTETPHLLFVNPGNMGNMGTILRTALGFGFHDVAIIRPGVDVFHPKTVRASMGAVFSLRIEFFDSFAEYRERFAARESGRELFSFMLDGKPLVAGECPHPSLYTLIFGNEATGLPTEYAEVGQSLLIPQSEEVDSLNLTVAAGIGMYLFRHGEILST